MPRLHALGLLGLLGLAAAAGPPSRLPAPKVEEVDGRKVARIVYGKHNPTVTVGPLEFTLEPVRIDPAGRPALSFLVTNRSNAEVDPTPHLPNWPASATALQDDTGRPFRPLNGTDAPAARILAPGRSVRFEMLLSPDVNRAAKQVAGEVDAPPGSAADRWHVTFPRATWVKVRPSDR